MSTRASVPDYSESGLTIQAAMVDLTRRYPERRERPELLWAGRTVKTADAIAVPRRGTVRGEFLSSKGDVEQGFDLKVVCGLRLEGGEEVPVLRTRNDPRLAPSVEYPFSCRDGRLWLWNVYKMQYARGETVEEKWTGNAGMWVEERSPSERIYHCSHGMAKPPDFECVVFRIAIRAA